MPKRSESSIEEIQARVYSVYYRLVGFVALVIGIIFLGLTGWAAHKVYLLVFKHPIGGALGVTGAFLIIALFFLYIGWRFTLLRPNPYGSLFTPSAWRILGVLFGILGVGLLAVVSVFHSKFGSDDSLLLGFTLFLPFVFSYGCFWSAQRVIARANADKAP